MGSGSDKFFDSVVWRKCKQKIKSVVSGNIIVIISQEISLLVGFFQLKYDCLTDIKMFIYLPNHIAACDMKIFSSGLFPVFSQGEI